LPGGTGRNIRLIFILKKRIIFDEGLERGEHIDGFGEMSFYAQTVFDREWLAEHNCRLPVGQITCLVIPEQPAELSPESITTTACGLG
jgi:hypothetical protein